MLLHKDGALYNTIHSYPHTITGAGASAFSFNIDREYSVDAGSYNVMFTAELGGGYGADVTFSSIAMSKSFNADVRRTEFGRNGFMIWYQNNHFHFTEEYGLDIRGSVNMPGVLAAGSVSSGGVQSNVWGAKSNTNGATPFSGGFTVPLSNLAHNNYVVQITPYTNVTFRVGAKTKDNFTVYGTDGFDYVVIGKNYG